MHGDDWKEGIQKSTRQQVIDTLKEWGGELIEVSYTQGISSTKLNRATKEIGTTPNIRLNSLRRLLGAKPLIRVNEVHNGLSGLITENTKVQKKNQPTQNRNRVEKINPRLLTRATHLGHPLPVVAVKKRAPEDKILSRKKEVGCLQ